MALTTNDVLKQIDDIHAEKPMHGHPLWAGMVDGTWSLEQARYICQQHGGIPLHNHNYHGNLYVICPDPAWRVLISEVAYEESTGRIFSEGVSHHQLYLNFAAGLGLDPSVMYDPPYCAGVAAFQGWFATICSKTFLEGVAAHMLAGEAAIPGLYGRIADTLRKKFGLDDKAVAYWIIHDHADGEHSDVGRRLLDQFATNHQERELVLKTVNLMLDIQHLMYSDIYDHARNIGERAAA